MYLVLNPFTHSLFHRLSELASARLRYNNPDIADLSDENRATKLAEKLSELYDNEWTDLFEVTKQQNAKLDDVDKSIAEGLRDVLKVNSCLANRKHYNIQNSEFEREMIYETLIMR